MLCPCGEESPALEKAARSVIFSRQTVWGRPPAALRTLGQAERTRWDRRWPWREQLRAGRSPGAGTARGYCRRSHAAGGEGKR